MAGGIRTYLDKLRRTPLHPQWFSFLREDRNLRNTCSGLNGLVLDVGAAEGRPRRFLPPDVTYVALDYYETATGWYRTRPDVFGDAQSLPFVDGCVDHALLLDVIEHLPDPERCLGELRRVIRPGGSLTIQVPFLYPLHDEPLDYQRWTRHGLRLAAARHGYEVTAELALGHPLETAALNANIALSKSVINWIHAWNPLALTALVAPFAIVAINSVAWLLATLSRDDDFMPHAYRVVWTRR